MSRRRIMATAFATACALSGCTSIDNVASPGLTVESHCSAAHGYESEIQLTLARLSSDGTAITVTWDTNEAVPTSGWVTYSAIITNPGRYYQAVLAYEDGQPSAFVVADLGLGGQTVLDLATAPEFPKNTVKASFPRSAMPGINQDFTWQANLTLAGMSVSYCPSLTEFAPHP